MLWEREGFEWNAEWKVPNLPVDGLRDKIGEIASQVYGDPSRQLRTIGITGTNGKTSCCHWIAQCLTDMGKKTAMVGTLGNGFSGALAPAANTTPDAVSLHALLRDYLAEDAKCVAMEVSSHGLAQGRVNGVHFDVAVLTNLSRDHLDYHGDMESYFDAKMRLFDEVVASDGAAVVWADDAWSDKVIARVAARGLRLTDDLIGDDGLVAAWAHTDLQKYSGWDVTRVIACDGAGFACEQVSLTRPSTWTMQYKRLINYSVRFFQNRIVSDIMTREGPDGLPPRLASLYSDWLARFRPRAGLTGWFDRKALARMRKAL